MKKIVCIILSFLCLTGCSSPEFLPERVEIEDMAMVQMLGVDKSEDDGISLSVLKKDIEDLQGSQSDSSSQGGSGGQEENGNSGGGESGGDSKNKSKDTKSNPIISSSGKTFADCQINLQKNTQKNLFFGGLEHLIFGKEAASEGLYKYMDYISRETNFRIDTLVYLSKESSKKLLEDSSKLDYFLSDYLDILYDNNKFISTTSEKSFMDIFSESFDGQKISLIPLIAIGGNKENPSVELNGYGVFKNLKFVCYIEDDTAKGYNILLNQFNQDILTIRGINNEEVSLSISNISCAVAPKIKNGKLKEVLIKCKIKSDITEDHDRTDYSKSDNIKKLQKNQADTIKKYINRCISKSKKEKCDFIHLYKKIRAFYGDIYKENKDDWNEFYSKIDFTVTVDSQIERGYDSREGEN